MNRYKIILLIISVVMLFGACSNAPEENQAFNSLLSKVESLEQNVSQYTADIQQQMSNTEDAYTVLSSSSSSQIMSEAEEIKSELAPFSDTIDAQTITDTQNRIDAAINSLKDSGTAVSNYYIDTVSAQVSDILSDYNQLEDKSLADTKSTQDLVNQLNSLAENQIIRDIHLSSESMVLASFISARDAYNNWIAATEKYSQASVSSENKETSKALVNDYLSSTTEYYNFHLQAMEMIMTLDDTYSQNITTFFELFTPYTVEYENVIASLNNLLED